MSEEDPTCTLGVHLRGIGVLDELGDDAYYHSNAAEGVGASWGAKDGGNAWVLEWEGEFGSGVTVHIRGVGCEEADKYYHSNAPEGNGASWGEREDDNAWVLEWDGAELTPETILHLKGLGCPEDDKYYHSNASEDNGASWGEKEDGNAWLIEMASAGD